MGAVGTTKDWGKIVGATEDLEASIEAEKFSPSGDEKLEDVKIDLNQVRELARMDLNFFAGLAMPTVFQYMFSRIMVGVWILLLQYVVTERTFFQIALGIPRGFAKTTLVKLFVLYCILYTKKKFIVILSSTGPNAENVVADVFDMLNEPNIKEAYGQWDVAAEIDRQNLKKFAFRGRVIVVAGLGAGGSVRGLNIKNARPDVIIFEDLQTKECSESKIESDALERWMLATAMKAKSPHGCLTIYVGNMYPGPNCILKKLKSNPNWIKFISGAILADGTSLWEELRPLKELYDEFDNDIASGHPEIFLSEMMNDTEVAINSHVDLSKLKEWPWGEFELPQGKFILIDPSTGKVGRDAVAIGRFEVYDQVPALREVAEESFSPGATISQALLWCLKYDIFCVIIEATAYQATLAWWFNKKCEELGIEGIQCLEIHATATSKNFRIMTMLKGLQAGETVLHPTVKARVIHQIANWNSMKRDNVDGILDLLTYAPKVLEQYEGAIIAQESTMSIEASSAVVRNDNHAF